MRKNSISLNFVLRIVSVAAVVLMAPVLAHAQSGCGDSPENPTAVLALVGSAGALFSAVRQRIKARRGSGSK